MTRSCNANKPWDRADYVLLGELWGENATLKEMAVALGRSGSSVCAQLAIRGYLYFSSTKMAYYPTNPYCWETVKEVRAVDNYMKEN